MSSSRLLTAATLCSLALIPFAPAPSLIELMTVTEIQSELNSSATSSGLHALNRVEVNTTVSDLRTISHAVEQYRADNGAFPVPVRMSSDFGPAPGDERVQTVFTFTPQTQAGPGNLTYPRAYLSNMPYDRFSQGVVGRELPYAYFVDRQSGHYILYSPGPDNDYDIDVVRDFWSGNRPSPQNLRSRVMDPNNPSETDGDLVITNRPL